MLFHATRTHCEYVVWLDLCTSFEGLPRQEEHHQAGVGGGSSGAPRSSLLTAALLLDLPPQEPHVLLECLTVVTPTPVPPHPASGTGYTMHTQGSLSMWWGIHMTPRNAVHRY